MAGWQEPKQFLDFFNRHGVDWVNLCARCPGPTSVMKGRARARDRAEAENSLGWVWYENLRGAEIYVRPALLLPDGSPARWPVVFLDDVAPEQAIGFAGEYSACVVETSPGRCHLWLAVSRPLDVAERKVIQGRLCGALAGDPGSVSGEHFGRLPGFLNHKRGCAVRILKTSTARLYPVGDLTPPPPPASTVHRHTSPARTPSAGGLSESEREFGWALGRLRWARDRGAGALEIEIEHVRDRLTVQAEARGKRNPRDYARRTVDAALRHLR